jgi:hypothetical protein
MRKTYKFVLTVDSSLHLSLDTYEFFAVTVSLETGKRLYEFLEKDLRTRQRLMDQTDTDHPRRFDVSARVVSLSLLVLIYFSLSHWEMWSFS